MPALYVQGYRQVTSLAAVVGLPTVPPGTKTVLIQAEAQNVRWRDDGADPTAGVGMLLASGTTMQYELGPSPIKFIEATSGAKLNITYLGIRRGIPGALGTPSVANVTSAGTGTFA